MNDVPEVQNTDFVYFSMADRPPGRVDPSRMGKRNPVDTEPYPTTSPEDFEATRAELAELRRRRTPKSA